MEYDFLVSLVNILSQVTVQHNQETEMVDKLDLVKVSEHMSLGLAWLKLDKLN